MMHFSVYLATLVDFARHPQDRPVWTEATLVEIKCIIRHWQECRSLPMGPELTGEELFAGERLGYSCFCAQCFESGCRDIWVVLFLRVLVKSSAYACA